MKKRFIHAIAYSAAFIITLGIAHAKQPGQGTIPNGISSVPRFNLNIHGKNSSFSCPELKYYSDTDSSIFGVIPES